MRAHVCRGVGISYKILAEGTSLHIYVVVYVRDKLAQTA